MAQTAEPYEFSEEASIETTGSFNEIVEKQQEELSQLKQKSPTDPETEGIVDGIVRFPVADGFAVYRVVDDNPLTLQHIPIGDRYQIPDAHIRGLREEDIVQKLKHQP